MPALLLVAQDAAPEKTARRKCRGRDGGRSRPPAGASPGLPLRAADIAPALRRALAADAPYLVNVVTDPEVAYPRSTTGV